MASNKKHYIIATLAVLPIILLLLQYFFFVHIDAKYSAAIDQELETMTMVHKLTSESANDYFMLRVLLTSQDTDEVKETESEWQKNTKVTSEYIDSLAKTRLINLISKKTLDYIVNARSEYISNCQKFLDLYKTGNKAETEKYFQENVRKDFFVYQNFIANFVEIQNAEISAYNNSLTEKVKVFDLDFKILGIPLIYYIALVYLLCALLFVLYLYRTLINKLKKKTN